MFCNEQLCLFHRKQNTRPSRSTNYSVIGIKKAVLKFVIFQKEMSPKKDFFLYINIKFLFYFLEPYLFRTDLFWDFIVFRAGSSTFTAFFYLPKREDFNSLTLEYVQYDLFVLSRMQPQFEEQLLPVFYHGQFRCIFFSLNCLYSG